MLRTAQLSAESDAAQIDVDNVKVGHGRWWLWPLVVTAILAVTIAVIVVRA